MSEKEDLEASLDEFLLSEPVKEDTLEKGETKQEDTTD